MKSRMAIAGIISGLLVASAPAVSAQPADTAAPRPFQRMISDLKLTKDQQAKLQAQHREMREQGKLIMEQMKKIRAEVKTELLKDKPSQAVLDDCANRLAGLHKQQIQKRHTQLLQAKAIMTPEQFSKLVNHESKRPGPERGRPFHGKDKGKHGPPPCDMDAM